MTDSSGTRRILETPLGPRAIWQIKKAGDAAQIDRLPYSIKVLLESCLRNHDGRIVTDADVRAIASYDARQVPEIEIPFMPGRVILQDFTGVPAVVDLAAMRAAMTRMGGDPRKVNPLVPCDLVIDHSVQVDVYNSGNALRLNSQKEFERNRERYEFLKWGQRAFNNFRVVPPATGIVHQVNLEYLAKVVWDGTRAGTSGPDAERVLYPDSLVGTDSHTTMINGLGVVGWGVGGIEAEAVMLGQPIFMLLPEVVGFRVSGDMPRGTTATDLVLRVTQMLRKHGVVNKFVEFFGSGLDAMPVANRATLANMAPEYGATIGFFPIDEMTLQYLRLSGRDESLVQAVEQYSKEQGMWRDDSRQIAYTSSLDLDLATIEPSLAGPKRPQDRVSLADMQSAWHKEMVSAGRGPNGDGVMSEVPNEVPTVIGPSAIAAGPGVGSGAAGASASTSAPSTAGISSTGSAVTGVSTTAASTPGASGMGASGMGASAMGASGTGAFATGRSATGASGTGAFATGACPSGASATATITPRYVDIAYEGYDFALKDGSVVIAAITSCTNTSNPSVLIGAGLLARNALRRGLGRKPWVKTSLAPGSKVVTEYLQRAGLLEELERVGFYLVGYGCTTCIGNSGPLPEPISEGIKEGSLVVASVLSGNRNFEGRVHPEVRANYLASPPLVVAYALAGTVDIDLTREPIGKDKSGVDVYLVDIWPSEEEISEVMARCISRDQFVSQYGNVFAGSKEWQDIPTSGGDLFQWPPDSTYIQEPPYFMDMAAEPGEIHSISNARCLAMLGDSVTTDHISPAGSISSTSPAGRFLIEHGVEPAMFNSYGARRGNDRVMTRGTFASGRVKNALADGREGGWTRDFTDGVIKPIYDASLTYKAEGIALIVLAGKDYGMGSSRDWAAKGTFLLGVRAVIAESFERIHRSNLVGMGVLPLTYRDGENAASLGLTGEEIFTVKVPQDLKPRQEIMVTARSVQGAGIAAALASGSGSASGVGIAHGSESSSVSGSGGAHGSKSSSVSGSGGAHGSESSSVSGSAGAHGSGSATASVKIFSTLCRIDTPVEVEYYRNGGILHTVLRRMAKE